MKSELAGLREITETSSDPEMKQLAYGEMEEARGNLQTLEEELKTLLIPKDPTTARTSLSRSAPGREGTKRPSSRRPVSHVLRYAEKQGWKVEVLDLNDTGIGGIKEISFALSGNDVYGSMKFESGVHRVQRVPETETQGRVHTSPPPLRFCPRSNRSRWISIGRPGD